MTTNLSSANGIDLRALMSEHKLKRADVARLLGLVVRKHSHGTVDSWLSGQRRMPPAKLRLIQLELETIRAEMTKYPFHVYATAFHGGQLISKHTTAQLASAAVHRWVQRTGRLCTCGCAGVIDTTARQKPGTWAAQDSNPNPYAIGAV